MQAIRKIDDYFIGSDDGTLTDRAWFYGTYFITGAITVATLFGL